MHRSNYSRDHIIEASGTHLGKDQAHQGPSFVGRPGFPKSSGCAIAMELFVEAGLHLKTHESETVA